MLPRLYDGKASRTAYNHNGYGFFNKVKRCEVSEERNGEYFLELEIFHNDRLINIVTPGMIIKAKANATDEPQLFEINDHMEFDKYGNLFISASHVKSIFMKNCIYGTIYNEITGTPQSIMNDFISDSSVDKNVFSFTSNIEDEKTLSAEVGTVGLFNDICFNDKGLIDTFGGEFYYDNFDIYLKKNRGRTIDYTVRYGSAISDYIQTITSANVYSHLMGYATVNDLNENNKDGSVTVSITPIATGATISGFTTVKKIDFSDKCKKYEVNSSNGLGYTDLEERLKNLTESKIVKQKAKLTEPEVNIKINYEPILEELKKIKLCDKLNVIYGKKETKIKVIKTVYDSIRERYTLIELGEKKLKLTDLL